MVCGITNSAVQKRLLAEKELTLGKAVSLAQAVEIAERGSKDLQTPPTSKATANPDAELYKFNSGIPKKPEDKPTEPPKRCYRCGGKHFQSQCRFKTEQCHNCHKRGHIAKVCQSKPQAKKTQATRNPQPVHNITDNALHSEYQLFAVHSHTNSKPLKTTLLVEGQELAMEIDTGAAVSLISEETVNSSSMKVIPLQPSDVRLRTYTGETVPVLGKLMVRVVKDEASITLPLLVVKGSGTTLLGRDWLQELRLDWKAIFSLQATLSLQQILDAHKSVFTDELGTFKKSKVKFHLKDDAEPVFIKARQVPFALRDRVADELDRLQAAGIITPTQFSQWATPVVPIIKKDSSIRICGDFRQTVNKHAKTEIYPLPRIEELFASLSGGQSFTTLDLSHAYLQLELEEESQELVTINTHKGLYRYRRLPFGVASAPAIFQRTMEATLHGLPMVCVYLDDILVSGKTPQEHLTIQS